MKPIELPGLPQQEVMIPDWTLWVAQDRDGTWWAYEAEPNQAHNGWYENEVGRIQRLTQTESNPYWQKALFRI